MDTKSFIVNLFKYIAWPFVTLMLGLKAFNLFSSRAIPFTGSYLNLPTNIFWDILSAAGTAITALIAIVAFYFTREAGIFEKTPNVLASGAFFISINDKDEGNNKRTNDMRDMAIDVEHSIHTFQLINIGRGLAKNIIPSIREDVEGKLLEDVSPHSFVLPSGKSTRDLGEILRVYGQRFVKGEKNKTIEIKKDENDTKVGWFYIDFNDHSGKTFQTKVKIKKVKNIDKSIKGRAIEDLIKNPDIELWKVTDNTMLEI